MAIDANRTFLLCEPPATHWYSHIYPSTNLSNFPNKFSTLIKTEDINPQALLKIFKHKQ